MVEKEILIIGGGPGGYVAAIRAAQLGGTVTLVEKNELGGTCLNWGCIPTKALLRGVELLEALEGSKDFGIQVGEISVDFSRLMARKDRAVKTLVSGVGGLMKANGIAVVKGQAKFISPQEIEVLEEQGGKVTYRARKIILATGSISADLPVSGAKGPGVIDSNGALQLTQVPESMVIIGAGPIGLEFGTIFAALGSKVTILEMMDQILPSEDPEVASALEKSLRRFKIRTLTNCRVKEISEGSKGKRKVVATTGEDEKVFEAQYILMAVGRKANREGLGLAAAGVQCNPNGIVVNERMETNVPGIYAIGDVTGQWLLAHFAMAQGLVAAENALGHEARLDRRVVPRCVYTLPEVASVGMTEKEAQAAGYELKTGRFPFAGNGKATILGERNGFVKMVAEAKYGEILGVHIFGPHATDLIGEAVLSMHLEGTAADMARAIHPHPTLAETLMEAALDADGMAVHIPPRKKV
ncbi:MAG: dihydrolipoyl dehydrogenase [Deltaproteobacteria bacterium]|jgi:dihydrolipoamide dehydrogenase|nr:dihydrolipoyl dehydrogenase [Deltaproteobacteria bacterium]